jgi:hypothetical protein
MHPGRGVIIGAATPAGLARRLVHGHRNSGLRQPHGSGKAGKSGAYDVDMAWHQSKP